LDLYKNETWAKIFQKKLSIYPQVLSKKFGNITPISVQNFGSNSLKNREIAFITKNQ
jgi:hypothetical protein